MDVDDVIDAIWAGEFDDGDELRRIVNAARKQGEVRQRRRWPLGSRAQIDAPTSQWHGTVGYVSKANATSVWLDTNEGNVKVPQTMLVLPSDFVASMPAADLAAVVARRS